MTSDVSICNRALQKLGAASITSLDDNNVRGRAMNLAFEPVRDAELRRHRWRFAIKRTSIARLVAAPDSGFSYQYQVPNDFLRLIEGGDIASTADLSDYRGVSGAAYSVENGRILTNYSSPLAIRYIARITDASLFDSAFCEALSARLAVETCETITESTQKKADLFRDYQVAIREAVRANSLEVASEAIADDTWVLARIAS